MMHPSAREAQARGGENLDAVLVFNLLKTQNSLAPFMDAGLREERMTAAQFNALLVLASAGREGLLMGEIGRRLVVTKSNVTGLVDRLERRGWARRDRRRDRRAVAVRLTTAGSAALKRSMPRYADLLTQVTGCLTDREKRTLAHLLSKLRRELRRSGTKPDGRVPERDTASGSGEARGGGRRR